MLRRLTAVLLIVAFAVPWPALAGGGCSMDVPMLAAERCACCTAPMTTAGGGCAGAALGQAGCGCSIRSDSGVQPMAMATSAAPTVEFSVKSSLLAACLSTPQRALRSIALATSPPGAGAAVFRPRICSWII